MRSSYRVLPLNIQESAKIESSLTTCYFRSFLVIELIVCTLLLMLGLFLPSLIPNALTIRPIPYQVLSTGDVILDFRLNSDVVHNATIPDNVLLSTCLLLPLALLVAVSSFTSRSFYDVHAIVCVLFAAFGMSEIITNTLKMYVGRLRPNFYSLCEFSIQTLKCMADDSTVSQGRRSFPSGHSSFSFCGMGVLVYFFLGRLGHLQNRPLTTELSSFSKSSYVRRKPLFLLCFSPWLYSTFVACSRLVDNWHHPSDIVAGSLIGIFCSFVAYHLWYPFFCSQYSGAESLEKLER